MNSVMILCRRSVKETNHLETPDFGWSTFDHVVRYSLIFSGFRTLRGLDMVALEGLEFCSGL